MCYANKSVQVSEREREGGVWRGREDCGQKNWDSDSERLVTESHTMNDICFHQARGQDQGQMFFVFACVSEKVLELVAYCTGALFDWVYILN